MDIYDKLFEVAVPFENEEEDCYIFISPITGKTLEDVLSEVLKKEVGTGKYVVEERHYYVGGFQYQYQGNVFCSWIEPDGQLNYDIFPWMA